jgi:hypothetical protein
MGLDVYLYDGEQRPGDIDSATYPEHYFKKNYLRSSYNEGGINRVATNLIGKDLYWVFEPGDRYEFTPDWTACKTRAEQFLTELKVAVDANPYRVTTVDHNHFSGVAKVSAEQALQTFIAERQKHPTDNDFFSSYSNGSGHFFMKEPLPVVAAIPGTGLLGSPCVHLVYKDDSLNWYVEAAAIVIEFIDHAMTLNQPVLHWSS